MTASRSAMATPPSSIKTSSVLWLLAAGTCTALVGCASDDPTSPFGFASGGGAGAAGSSSGAATYGVSGSSFSGVPLTGGSSGNATVGSGGSAGGGGAGGTTSSAGTAGGGAASTAGEGSGGSAPLGGTDGGGGTPPFMCGKSTGAEPLFDNFEDSNGVVSLLEGRSGNWETFDDTSLTGSYAPKSPTALEGRNASVGYCVAVSGYSVWGANLVANMSAPKCGYDASAYKGVCFWAKGSVVGGGPIVFAVGTRDTVPVSSGGECATNCNAHYELKLTGDSALGEEYKEYCVEWDKLALPSIPEPLPMDAKTIVQMEWKFPAGGGKSTDGEICIDDIRFMQ